jgi:hypothetical protein
VGVVAESARYSQALGRQAWGSLGAATTIANLYSSAVFTGTPFVDERQLRTTLTQRVTGAQESDMARAISGAATSVAPEKREAFVQAATAAGQSGTLTLDRIAELARGQGATGTGQDFLLRGYTTEAEKFRATGAAGAVTMAANMGTMAELRRQEAAMVLGIGVDKLGKASTLEEMKKELTAQKITMTGTQEGLLSQMFDRDAQAFGYKSRFEVDSTLAARERAKMQENIIDRGSRIEKNLLSLGRSRGALGLISYIQGSKDRKGAANLGDAFRAFTGDTDLSWQKFLEAEGGQKKLEGWGAAMETDKEVFMGMDVLWNALESGTLGDEILKPEKLTELREILKAGPTEAALKKVKDLTKHATEEQKKGLRLLEIQQKIQQKRGALDEKADPKKRAEEESKIGREATFRDNLTRLKENTTSEELKETISKYQREATTNPGMLAEEWAKKDKSNAENLGKLRTALAIQGVSDLATGVGTDQGTGSILNTLMQLFSSVIDQGSGALKVVDKRAP